jgi:probable rRNA maturation factor
MRVQVTAQAPLRRGEVRRLKKSIKGMARELLGRPGGELSVALVGTDEMKRLNSRYRGLDQPTDVLAFPMMASDELSGRASLARGRGGLERGEPLGDIAICVPVAERQALERGEKRFEELELLAAHGFLHLLGYDDADDEGAASMAEMENRLLGRNILR